MWRFGRGHHCRGRVPGTCAWDRMWLFCRGRLCRGRVPGTSAWDRMWRFDRGRPSRTTFTGVTGRTASYAWAASPLQWSLCPPALPSGRSSPTLSLSASTPTRSEQDDVHWNDRMDNVLREGTDPLHGPSGPHLHLHPRVCRVCRLVLHRNWPSASAAFATGGDHVKIDDDCIEEGAR